VDSDEDSDAYIKLAKKTKPTAMAQPSMTDFFEKKPAGSKAVAKPASRTTTCKPSGSMKPPPKKVTAKKAAQGSNDKISMDELPLESAVPVAPCATTPRRAAATAKPTYIELLDSDNDD
jgi:hypothetical protein